MMCATLDLVPDTLVEILCVFFLFLFSRTHTEEPVRSPKGPPGKTEAQIGKGWDL